MATSVDVADAEVDAGAAEETDSEDPPPKVNV